MDDSTASSTDRQTSGSPRALGLSHVTFIVRDLDRMETILATVLGARRVYDSGDDIHSLSPERFFLVGDDDAAVWVAIMRGDRNVGRTYDHVAFRVRSEDLDEHRRAVETLGLDVRPARPRVDGEAESLYFHDDDGHLFELHTGTLAERLARYRS